MKKAYIISVLFFSCAFIFAQNPEQTNPNGYTIFYYDDGKKSSEGTLRAGKPDGYWKTYYPNGNLKSEGNRKDFQLDSTWKFYSENKMLNTEINYKNGKKNGFKKTYSPETEELAVEEHYVNDVKHGPERYYYKGRKIKQIIPFDTGKEEGMSYEFSTDSVIITLIEYQAGFIKKQERINRKDNRGLKQGIWKEFHDNGVVGLEGKYIDGKKNGYFNEYTRKGDLIVTRKYINDIEQKDAPELSKVEVVNEYYQGGKLKSTGGYKQGKPEGLHKEISYDGDTVMARMYAEGILISEGIMDRSGKEQGTWKEYHPNGQLKSRGEYMNGLRVGEWVFYHPNGQMEQKGVYNKNGKPDGKWRWYYDTGNILREENFINGLEDGMANEYSDSGNVITKGEYVEGMKEGLWVYELGDYKEEGSYKSDLRDGIWRHYYLQNGNLRYEGKYINGNPDGKHTYYYPNGKVKEQGRYVVGRKEGDWKYYTEEGLAYLTIEYENDIEIKFDGVKIRPSQGEIEQEAQKREKQ